MRQDRHLPGNSTRRTMLAAVAALAVVAVLAGCGGVGSDGGSLESTAESSASSVETLAEPAPVPTPVPTSETALAAAETTAPPTPDTEAAPQSVADSVAPDPSAVSAPVAAALDPLDDLDEDGSADDVCGTADLGGGLVVQPLCDTSLQPTPEDGVSPTVGSLLLLPAPPRWEDLAEVDATVRVAKAADGRRVVIYVLGSDTLFDSGQAAVRSTAQPPLAAIVASISTRYPTASINVRGAADSVGTREANQALSEQRAEAIAQQLIALGLDGSLISSQGLGADVPVAEELNADGSVNEIGRQVNRRVEIVVG